MQSLVRPVLVSIDMQQAFDLPGSPRRGNTVLDRNGRALLSAWRSRKFPIIHVRHDSIDPRSLLRPEHPGNAFRPGFEAAPDEALISKSVNSAFIGTDLDLRLRRLEADAVVVFGMTTDMCVSTTVRMGANLGWTMIVVGDACDCCDLADPFSDGVIRAEHCIGPTWPPWLQNLPSWSQRMRSWQQYPFMKVKPAL